MEVTRECVNRGLEGLQLILRISVEIALEI